MAGGSPRVPAEWEYRFWDEVRAGGGVREAAQCVGVSRTRALRWVYERGGVKPSPQAGARTRSLSFAEREQIAVLTAAGMGVRKIAASLGRCPSTISRELRRVAPARSGPTAGRYVATRAQGDADVKARRPKPSRLATDLRLRREVQRRLSDNESPEQIAGRLRLDFPDEQEMWVSHETIYQALYVQSRGALNRELTRHLRTGRAVRKSQRRPEERRGRIPGMVMISERPAEVEDRAVPGHWEGDLIVGSQASNSAIGTLVERSTGFVMLLHLPDGTGAESVAAAMTTKMLQLPEHLRRSLTWDQGREMREHAKIAQATGLDIYFCDPHSPWQRGSNENTNGLLRQYFPKGTDLSFWGPGYLDKVASELNARPRKRHGYLTPAEVLDKLLSTAADDDGVATAG